jgi:hypothetical protein
MFVWTGRARADTFGTSGYICEVSYAFDGTDYYGFKGNYGSIIATVTSSPNCTGTKEYNFICTTGATNPACNVPTAQRSEAGILALFQILMRAKETQLKFWMHHHAWNSAGGGIGNMYSVDFLGYQQ